MLSIKVEFNKKYKFIIVRNNREIAEFPTKKEARSTLHQIKESYAYVNFQQEMFNYSSNLFNGGDWLTVYTNFQGGEFKDIYKIKRVANE